MRRDGKKRIGLWLAAAGLLVLIAGRPAMAEVVHDLDLQLGAGYRMDDLDWNIAGTPAGTDPNVLSELSWRDLEIYQVRAGGKLNVGRSDFPWFTTVLKGSAGYGWIVDGAVRDSDFLGDNRTLEFSRSESETGDEDVWDASLGVGFQFPFRDGRVKITPLGGYSWHEQNLELTDGVQVLDPFDLFGLGPFPGLASTYETEWKGPWAGVDLEYTPAPWLTLAGSFAYHWVDYDAEANWNLRDDFAHPKSFEHEAEGEGVTLSAAAALNLGERWRLELSYDYLDWETDPGTDRIFLASGPVLETRLNEVNWESQALMLGVTYRFF